MGTDAAPVKCRPRRKKARGLLFRLHKDSIKKASVAEYTASELLRLGEGGALIERVPQATGARPITFASTFPFLVLQW